MRNTLYVTESYLNFSIECSREFNKLQTYSGNSDNRRVVINVVRPKDNRSCILINCWVSNAPDKPLTLVFTQKAGYTYKQRYYITYYFDKTEEVIRCENVGLCPHKEVDGGISNDAYLQTENIYHIDGYFSPKAAKKELRFLLKNNLIGKQHWDKDGNWGDICCLACHTKGSPYMPLSTPMYGKVFLKGSLWEKTLGKLGYKDAYNLEDEFSYGGLIYKKIPSNEWWETTYYNEKEWEAYKELYEPVKVDWVTAAEYEETVKAFKHIQFKPGDYSFEDDWKKSGSYWRDPAGNISNFGGKNPVIGSYERVYSPQIAEYNEKYASFKDMCKKETTAYRRISDGVIIKNLDTAETKSKKVYEKVFTLGYMNTPKRGSVDCPVCKAMHEISRSCNIYGFWRGRIIYPARFFFNFYKNPNVIKNKTAKVLSTVFKDKVFYGWKNGERVPRRRTEK